MKRKGRFVEFNYWPSVADMILAAFMVMLILWFSENLRSFALLADAQQAREQSSKLLGEVDKLRGENQRLARLLGAADHADLAAEVEKLRGEKLRLEQLVKDNDQPPNIVLSESSEYKFGTGSAALSPDFERRWR